jgi:hypothetical protein
MSVLGRHRTARRIEAVNSFEFPAGVRQRLGYQHPDLGSDDVRLVEAATRQWFRLVARQPRTPLSMPSVVVDQLWHELVLHTREYAAFCDAAFGRFLHHETTDRATGLLATLSLARRDEDAGPTDLPLLFNVDGRLRVPGGKRYLVDCGGRGECFPVAGLICLKHLAGPGKPTGTRGIRGFRPDIYSGDVGAHSAEGYGPG